VCARTIVRAAFRLIRHWQSGGRVAPLLEGAT